MSLIGREVKCCFVLKKNTKALKNFEDGNKINGHGLKFISILFCNHVFVSSKKSNKNTKQINK